jgi:hypothetical protein
MSLEWASNVRTRAVEREYTTTVDGLELKIVDDGSPLGFRWRVWACLDDFYLSASSGYHLEFRTLDEVKAAAEVAARRLLDLGARKAVIAEARA